MTNTDPTRKHLGVLRRMFRFLIPIKWTALFSCTILVTRIIVEVIAVYFLSPVITTIANSFVASNPQGFWHWIAGSETSAVNLRSVLFWMMASQLALSILVYLRSIWDTKLSMAVIGSMRSDVYDHLQHMEFSFYDRMTTGKLMSRALGDLDTVHGFINMSLLSVLDIVVSVGAYLTLIAWRSPWLLGAALLPLPVWCFVIFHVSKRAGPLYQRQRESVDGLLGVITENVAGRHVVRAFGSRQFEEQKFAKKNAIFLDRLLSVIRWQAVLNPGLQSMAIAVHILTFLVCAALIQRQMIPIGDLLILGAAMGTILGKLQNINGIAETFQRALVSGERLFEILDAQVIHSDEGHETNQLRHARIFDLSGADLRFDRVSFAYEPGQPVLTDISCTIRAGKVTAIVGPTGAGKTTFSALLARFYAPDGGRVLVGDQDIQSLSLRAVRHHVGFVFQETFLFSDTVRNNIRYGRLDVSDQMLLTAARAAQADEFIRRLPDGYETKIGEGGVQLSGGQRQRLALARALVYNPEVLILDDAMAALDASTEAVIRGSLKKLLAGRTILMITHRPSSLDLADDVLFMEKGRIVKAGSPHDFDLAELANLTTVHGGTA